MNNYRDENESEPTISTRILNGGRLLVQDIIHFAVHGPSIRDMIVDEIFVIKWEIHFLLKGKSK